MADKLKDACAYIEVSGAFGRRRGTGYLVRPDRAVTCEHVVRGAAEGAQIVLRFPSGERQATVERLDAENDCAVLRLDAPLPGVQPLSLAGSCARDAGWQAYGFPQATEQGGLLLQGHIADPQGEDRRRCPSIVLYTPSAVGGALLQGFSGSPVVLKDQVVGHLKQVIADDGGGAMMGFLYACPSRYIESLLPPLPTAAAARRPPQAAKASYDPSWYIARPAEEQVALDYLAYPGQPVVLWGPELFGKTWLLRHLLQKARKEEGARVVAVNLDLFDKAVCSSLESFLRELAAYLVHELGGQQEDLERLWRRDRSPNSNITAVLQRYALPKAERLLLAIDGADAIWNSAFADQFFGLLRAWAEESEAPWSSLRLLLAVSTTPADLIHNASQSPFNLTDPIRLDDLDGRQVQQLFELYGLTPAPDDLARLHQLVGGHPYLMRLALYTARRQSRPLAELLDPGPGPGRGSDGVFEPFLRNTRARLQQQPELLEAFAALLKNPLTPIPRPVHHKLERAGLLLRDGRSGALRPRYELYKWLPQT
jgi:hypothetical protein